VVDRFLAGLEHARWEYDDEADELEIVFPGAAGREGRAILIDEDFYLRLDADTNAPLSVIVPVVSAWLSRQMEQLAKLVAAPPSTAPPEAWTPDSHEAVGRSLARSVQASGALTAAVA
jgi:hypothetical protein